MTCFKHLNILLNSIYSLFIIKKRKIVDYSLENNSNLPILISGNIYTECAICFNIYALQNIKMLYPCGHRLYCNDCINKIQNSTNECPNCKVKIHSNITIYENIITNQENEENEENEIKYNNIKNYV